MEILKNRKSCYLNKELTPHKVLIQMISNRIDFSYMYQQEKLLSTTDSIRFLKTILSPIGQNKFKQEILKPFNIEFLSDYFEDRQDVYLTNTIVRNYNTDDRLQFDSIAYTSALKRWILTLLPEDLSV